MNNIDIEIEKLEKQLAALKKAKGEEDLCNKNSNFEILVYKEDHDCEDVYKSFSTFNELKQFWESPKCKLKTTDFISLTYLMNGKFEEFTASINSDGIINQKEFEDIVKVISTLDAWHLISMELAICNKHDNLRFMAFLRSNKLNELENFYDQSITSIKSKMSEDEYFKKIDEGKKYRLFG